MKKKGLTKKEFDEYKEKLFVLRDEVFSQI